MEILDINKFNHIKSFKERKEIYELEEYKKQRTY